MAHSMTGYGRAEAEGDGRRVTIEAKSVNHRFIDFNIKINGRVFQLDDRIRKAVKARFHRGSFDITVSIASETGGCQVKVNEELMSGFMSAAESLAEKYGLKYPPSMGDLFQVKDLFTVNDPDWGVDRVWPLVETALGAALNQLTEMRKTEGGHILEDMRKRFSHINSLVEQIGAASEKSAAERFVSLKERIAKLVEEVKLDETRIMQEAALLADKSDIAEELTRLSSHLKQSDSLMESGGPAGRKLEFLLQEIFREINTVGSKTTSTDVTRIVVDIKSELEKIREQAQNLE